MVSRPTLRRALLIALAVAVVLGVAGIFQHELWTPDEPREAEVGREMLLAHYSAMPTLGGTPFLEKPPLFAWITAASYGVFGVSTGAGRVPAALFGIGTMWIAYLLGKRAAGRLAGLCSAIVLGTMWQFSELSHKVALDDALVFFVAAGHLAFLRLRDEKCWFNYVAIGVCAGLAFLTKGVIGPGLLCAPPILVAAAMRDWGYVKRVLPLAFVAAVAGVAAFGLPWVMALVHTPGGGWPAVKTCLWTNTIGRTVAAEGDDSGFSGHANGPLYYVPVVLYVIAPWILAVPAIVKSGMLRMDRRGGRMLFLGLIYVAGAVLLSVPSGKRALYLVPLLPAAAVVPGVWLSRAGSRSGGSWDALTLRLLFWMPVAAAVAAFALLAASGFAPSSVPERIRQFVPAGIERFAPWLAAAAVAILVGSFVMFRAARGDVGRVARAAAVAVLLLFFAIHAVVFPMVDPLRDMSVGSREIAALIPAGEEIIALHPDETMRATIPFYTGRAFAGADEADDALKAIAEGRAKHLVVPDKQDRRLTPPLRRKLTLVKTVAISSTRKADVYEVRSP